MIGRLHFARKNQFLCLFSRIGIEVHFPVECPFTYLFEVIIQVNIRSINIFNYREEWWRDVVLSANNLGFDAKCSDKSLI